MNKEELDIMIEKISNIMGNIDITCMCGNVLSDIDLQYYQYPKSDDYWLYAHCNKCEYDYNYQKILRQYNKRVNIK